MFYITREVSESLSPLFFLSAAAAGSLPLAKTNQLARSYNHIARFYDALARLVFGNRLRAPQLHLLPFIPAGARMLILGGGTGWILEAIAAVHATGLQITYVDASDKMVALARQRRAGGNTVTFVTADAATAPLMADYDIVLTPFLLDNLTTAQVTQLIAHIQPTLTRDALWLNCDFCNTRSPGGKLLLRAMYVFFRALCGISARSLPDMDACFANAGFTTAYRAGFSNGFIQAAVYKCADAL